MLYKYWAFLVVPSYSIKMRRPNLIFAALFSLLAVVNSVDVIVTVPGYAVLNGTVEESIPSSRTFYGFRGVSYAEKPTPETRFLVSSFNFIALDWLPN